MEWGIFWAVSLTLVVFIPLMMMWLFAIVDLFGRADIGGFGKALWLLAILFLPVFGTLAYYLFRPLEATRAPASSSSREATLADLRARGVITNEQYEMEHPIPGVF